MLEEERVNEFILDKFENEELVEDIEKIISIAYDLCKSSGFSDDIKLKLYVVSTFSTVYRNYGELDKEVTNFIQSDFPKDSENIINVVKSVSLKAEKQFGKKWFERRLSPEWLIIRNIVSDADKIITISNFQLEISKDVNDREKSKNLARLSHEYRELLGYIYTEDGIKQAEKLLKMLLSNIIDLNNRLVQQS